MGCRPPWIGFCSASDAVASLHHGRRACATWMDVLDAGVYVAKWEAEIPTEVRTVLWGPLQAKEMGFDGWECQDGGETGFVYHHPHVKLAAGYGTSTLIMVNRLKRAFLTVYFGGYPANVKPEQRALDARKVVTAAEMFLGRLAKGPVSFVFQGETALVDNLKAGPAAQMASSSAAPENPGERRYGRRMGGRRTPIEEA